MRAVPPLLALLLLMPTAAAGVALHEAGDAGTVAIGGKTSSAQAHVGDERRRIDLAEPDERQIATPATASPRATIARHHIAPLDDAASTGLAIAAPHAIDAGPLTDALPDIGAELFLGAARIQRVPALIDAIVDGRPTPPAADDAVERTFADAAATLAPVTDALPLTPLAPPAPPAPADTPTGPPPAEATAIQAAPETPAMPLILRAAALLAALLPWMLHHRVSGRRLLDQPVRSALHDAIRDKPGATAAALARRLGVDPTTVAYHLRRLQKDGLLTSEGTPRRRRWFLAGHHAPDERARLLLTRGRHHVLQAVQDHPGATKTRLARAIGVSRTTLTWHLDRLTRAGLVRIERHGRSARVYAQQP